jgi:hypothetical protein
VVGDVLVEDADKTIAEVTRWAWWCSSPSAQGASLVPHEAALPATGSLGAPFTLEDHLRPRLARSGQEVERTEPNSSMQMTTVGSPFFGFALASAMS